MQISTSQNSTNFRARIPYNSCVNSAFEHAEKLLEKPNKKLEVHDFCENVSYLIKKDPKDELTLSFKASELVKPVFNIGRWVGNYSCKASYKNSMNSLVRTSAYFPGQDIKAIKGETCFDTLSSVRRSERIPEKNTKYMSISDMKEAEQAEKKAKKELESKLTIDSLKQRLLELKETLKKQ